MVHKKLLRTALPLLAAFLPLAMMAEDLSVSGRVTDQAGAPIAGVFVTTESSGISTITDGSGNFTLSVPEKESALLFKMTGMEDLRVRLDGERATIEARMTENQDFLDDVVAIGYGTISRSELSSSISSVNAGQIAERPTAFNATQAMAGKVAGYSVHNTSGRPGGENTAYIRGKWGLGNSSAPLYVVDGMVDVDINMINPNDIETIDVLKDAAATAIYGARGANGVVLVTTKSGKGNDGTITYSGTVGMGQATRYFEELADAYTKSLSHGHDLSFAKSNERNSVYASLGYRSAGGILRGTDANRLNTSLNFTSKINEWLDVRFGADYSSGVEERGDLVFDDLVYKSVLSPTPISMTSGYDYNTMLDKAAYRQRRQQMLLNAAGDIHLAKGLTLTVRGDYRGNYRVFGKSAPGGIEGATVADNGFANIFNSDVFRWSNEDYLTYKTESDRLKTTSVLGVSFNNLLFESSYGGTTDFSDNQYEYYRMQAGTVYEQAESAYAKHAMRSAFFRTNMTLDGKFLVGLTLRYDGTSNYGEEKKNGFFPALSLGWIITDFLKLRASYGSVGGAGVFVAGEPVGQNLKWEDARQANLGFDMSFAEGRVNLSADLYNNDVRDYHYPVMSIGETGYTTSWVNLGRVAYRGAEVTLNARPVVGDSFNWDLNLVYSLNNSKAVEIGGSVKNPLSPIFSTEGGEWNTINVNSSGSEPTGRVTPLHDLSLVNTFNLGGVSLMVDLMAKAGFWTYCDNWKTSYTADGPGAGLPWNGQYLDQYGVKGNYLRLRNLALTYDLKRDLLKDVKFFRGVTVGVLAENVFTLTDVPTIDPEDFVWNPQVGVSGGAYPRPMSVSGTLKLTF